MFPASHPHASLRLALVVSLFSLVRAGPGSAQDAARSVEDRTEGMTRLEGLFDLYWEERTGSLFWEIAEPDQEFLYQISMGSGLGSNPIGIDRGQLSGTIVLRPLRVGPRVLLMEPNYRFVANSDNPTEVEAVRDAFAPSVHWGFDVAAESDGRILVDATAFFLRDARGVVETLAQSGQGRYQLDRSRSAIYLPS